MFQLINDMFQLIDYLFQLINDMFQLINYLFQLINDIYISEEYYGENVLHMATGNTWN